MTQRQRKNHTELIRESQSQREARQRSGGEERARGKSLRGAGTGTGTGTETVSFGSKMMSKVCGVCGGAGGTYFRADSFYRSRCRGGINVGINITLFLRLMWQHI